MCKALDFFFLNRFSHCWTQHVEISTFDHNVLPLSTENDILIFLFPVKKIKCVNVFLKDETNCWPVRAIEIQTCASHNCCFNGFAEESMSSLVR